VETDTAKKNAKIVFVVVTMMDTAILAQIVITDVVLMTIIATTNVIHMNVTNQIWAIATANAMVIKTAALVISVRIDFANLEETILVTLAI